MGCQGAPATSEAVTPIYSILGVTALVKSENNTALEEDHLITRSLKILEPK